MRDYWSSNLSQAFFRVVFHRARFLEILYNCHYPELEGSVHRLRKVFLCNILANNTKCLISLRDFLWMRVLFVSKAEPLPPNIHLLNKHHHHLGLKLQCLCDSRTGYTWKFSMYGGANDNVAEPVVNNLVMLLFGCLPHFLTLVIISILTTVPLAMYLYFLELLGLIDVGCWGPVKRKKGDIVNYRREPLLACTFEDRKHVVILSTHGNGSPVKYTSRRNRVVSTCLTWGSTSFKMKGGPSGGM